jgi:hypothetical protein
VVNCILWGNIPDGITTFGTAANMTYSNIQGGHAGEGNMDTDPLFVDAANGDYHLQAGSPCIDAGDNSAIPAGVIVDLDGNPRIINGIVDMGAYEGVEGVSGVEDVEDFEMGDFSKFPWEHYGDETWVVTLREKRSGAYSAKAGSIDHDQSTTLQVTLDCVSGNITFYHKISSESGSDYLKFYIDGVKQDEWSGEQDWAQVSFGVTAGTRIFEWTYSKDGSESEDSDTAWIDDLVFPVLIGPYPPPPTDVIDTTDEFIVVDDFESYNDLDPTDPLSNRIFNTWIDGYGVATNGSIVGYDIPPFCEVTIVHGGEQSMPFFYSNTGQLYVKVNGRKVVYDGDAADMTKTRWMQWNIELAPLGVNLRNVRKLSIGIDGNGASGTLYVDDIRLYRTAPEPEAGDPNLMGWWKFDEGSWTTARDSSGNGNDGTLQGNPQWVAGKIGGALEFDGDDSVNVGNASMLNLGTDDWTITAWIKTTIAGTGDANKGTVFANGGDRSGGIRFTLAVSEKQEGSITLTTDDNSTKVQATSSATVNDGVWHHVVGIRNGTTLGVYIDGKLDGTNSVPAGYNLSGTSQHDAHVGAITDHRDNSLKKYFKEGAIDDVRIYSRALTANEVQQLMIGIPPRAAF